MAEFLERVVRSWLRDHRDEEQEKRQLDLHDAARAVIGSLDGGDPKRSTTTRAQLQKKLTTRRRNRSS